jgi:DMSO reductase family type II enzyme chaperone
MKRRKHFQPIDPLVRASAYKTTSLFFLYPKDNFLDFAKEKTEAIKGLFRIILPRHGTRVVGDLNRAIGHASLEGLQTEYVRLFEYNAICPPYESVFLKGKASPDQVRREVEDFYKKFGLQPSRLSGEFADHISMELEFMSFLIMAESSSDEKDTKVKYLLAEKEFLEQHLSEWLPAFSSSLTKAAPSGYFAAISKMADKLISEDGQYVRNCLG